MVICRNHEDIGKLVGISLETNERFEVTQERIDAFAHATEDHNWIHVDPEAAAKGPYGTTIAHGYLLLSLLPHVTRAVMRFDGVEYALNYGLDKVRFIAPVLVGSMIYPTVRVEEVTTTSDGSSRFVLHTELNIDGGEKPALVATGIGLVKFR